MKYTCAALILTSSVLAACGGGSGSGSSSGPSDPCGNALGNGNTIISGPAAPDGISNFDSPFRSLTVHPTLPGTIYVGTEDNGILRSTDSGVTWERLRAGLRHSGTAYPEVYDIAISTTDPDRLYAATTFGPGSPRDLSGPSIGGVYKSVDAGDNWERINCGLSNAAASSVYVSPLDEETALVGIGAGNASTPGGGFFAGGVFRTTDGGDNWQRVDAGTNDDLNVYYQLVARGDTDVYTFGLGFDVLPNNAGLQRSTDTGENWGLITSPANQRNIAYITVSADGQRIIANELDSFDLRVSENGGTTWSINNPAYGPNGPIRISPHDKDDIVIAANEDLWFSDNGLTSATQVVNGAVDFFQDIEFSPSDPLVIYAITRGYHLYRSSDGGTTFQFVIDLRTSVINLIP